MQSINYPRVAAGALLASTVLLVCEIAFIGLLGPTIMAAREAARMPAFVPRPILSIVELLSTGFLLIWIYAAIQPRYGAGMVTAMRSGLAVWIPLGMIATIHMIVDNFGLPTYLLTLIGAGILPIFLAASIAGASVYRE